MLVNRINLMTNINYDKIHNCDSLNAFKPMQIDDYNLLFVDSTSINLQITQSWWANQRKYLFHSMDFIITNPFISQISKSWYKRVQKLQKEAATEIHMRIPWIKLKLLCTEFNWILICFAFYFHFNFQYRFFLQHSIS